ncbi:hypothetical protein, partial [Rhizobium leguminosarum]|uniref:hypothetical protein n=1 Tax=Rhizobium leguminosarum TaxID=384 RepID=UPI003F9E5F9F
MKLAGHTIGVPDQLHLDQPTQAVFRDIVLANGQSITSGDGSTRFLGVRGPRSDCHCQHPVTKHNLRGNLPDFHPAPSRCVSS